MNETFETRDEAMESEKGRWSWPDDGESHKQVYVDDCKKEKSLNLPGLLREGSKERWWTWATAGVRIGRIKVELE